MNAGDALLVQLNGVHDLGALLTEVPQVDHVAATHGDQAALNENGESELESTRSSQALHQREKERERERERERLTTNLIDEELHVLHGLIRFVFEQVVDADVA